MENEKEDKIKPERWRPIRGEWGQYYHVSDYGNIKALARDVDSCNNARAHRVERPIKPQIHGVKKMLYFRAWHKYAYKVFFIHRIVAECFVKNQSKKTLDTVAFRDGNIHNCHYKNLYWTTKGEMVKSGIKKSKENSDG